MWGFGNRNAQYGTLLNSDCLVFGGGGAVTHLINNFRQVMSSPCQAAENQRG